jgi:hypothetical protein
MQSPTETDDDESKGEGNTGLVHIMTVLGAHPASKDANSVGVRRVC